jgi:hypothetical protein
VSENTNKWPQMPPFGDESYTREDWLLDTDPIQLRDEYQTWKALAFAAYTEAPALRCRQPVRDTLAREGQE